MAVYECLLCRREIRSEDVKRRVRCQYCGSKLLVKPRTVNSVVEAV